MGSIWKTLRTPVGIWGVLIIWPWGIKYRGCAFSLGTWNKILASVKLKDLVTRWHDVKSLSILATGGSPHGVLTMEGYGSFSWSCLTFESASRWSWGVDVVSRWRLLLLAGVGIWGVLNMWRGRRRRRGRHGRTLPFILSKLFNQQGGNILTREDVSGLCTGTLWI